MSREDACYVHITAPSFKDVSNSLERYIIEAVKLEPVCPSTATAARKVVSIEVPEATDAATAAAVLKTLADNADFISKLADEIITVAVHSLESKDYSVFYHARLRRLAVRTIVVKKLEDIDNLPSDKQPHAARRITVNFASCLVRIFANNDSATALATCIMELEPKEVLSSEDKLAARLEALRRFAEALATRALDLLLAM